MDKDYQENKKIAYGLKKGEIMNEVRLTELKVEYVLPKIEFDVTELERQVKELVEMYTDWVVTDNDIPTAKNVMADLNRVAKAISDKRIAIAKEIKKPLSEFEDKIKNLTTVLEMASRNIKEQVDGYVMFQKEQKRAAIKCSEHWADYMEFDDKWLNKTTPMDEIVESLLTQKKIFQSAVVAINESCDNRKLDSSKYLMLLSEKKPLEEVLELIKNDFEVKQQYSKPEPVVEPEPEVEFTASQGKYNFVVEIVGTQKEFDAVKDFMELNFIKYREL